MKTGCEKCKNGMAGRAIPVKPCANGDYALNVFIHNKEDGPGLIINQVNWALGYIDITNCPFCGACLVKGEE